MAGRVRIGLVGLGRMGRIHAANLTARCAAAELAGVFDADGDLAREVAGQLGVDQAASVADMLADPTVHAVAIATPTATHAALSVQAARAGKHVFCEKPIALDRQATLDTLAAVDAAGVTFQPGFHRRFDPDWAAAVARIRGGELGDAVLFRTSLRDMRPPPVGFRAGSGGFFVDVTIHDLDTARWMVGEVVEVSAHGATAGDPAVAELGDLDTAVVVLRFEGGALGVIDNCRAAGYGYECSTELVGQHATVRIDNPHRHHYEWRTPGWAARDLVADFQQRFPWAYAEELDAFARCVRDRQPPQVTAHDALAAFDLARAAETSWRKGRPIPVTPIRTGGTVIYQTG